MEESGSLGGRGVVESGSRGDREVWKRVGVEVIESWKSWGGRGVEERGS